MAVPLIGQGSTTSESPDLASLSDEEREGLAKLAEEHPEDVSDAVDVTTAFILFVNKDGSYGLTQDVTTKFAPDRLATGDDVYAACSVALSDLQAGKTAQLTAAQMAQVGQMMQQQQQAEAIRRQMAQNQAKGFKNL